MNSKQFLESTTSGAIASVSTPVGKTQTRGKGVYPNEKGGNLLTGEKTNKKYPNSNPVAVSEASRLTIPDSPYTRKNFGSEKLVEILKSRGWQGPFQIQQLGKKWIKALDGLHGISIDDYAMVQGKDPRYDGWVVYVGGYVFGIEYGYHTGDANKVAKWTKDWSQDLSEAKLDEEDVIIVPGQGNRIKPGFIPRDKDRTDHEVEMAKSDLFQANKNAKKIYELIKDIPETVGIEGWVQEKIIKANDYLNTVREYLEHKQVSEMTGGVIAGGGVGEGVAEGSENNFVQPNLEVWYEGRFAGWTTGKVYDDPYGKDGKMVAFKPNPREYQGDEGRILALPHSEISLRKPRSIGKLKGSGQGLAEGYRIVPPIDRERYGDRSYEGLEGPFRARNGKVYYYDPKAGMAYDPDTDIYIDYDELKMMDTEMSEGIVGKVLGGAALLAALWGIGQNQAQQVYSNSPQLQTLIKYHQMATQQGDQAKIEELERRIENHKTRLSLGKGEVMGDDDKPIVPRYESSIMKGIQNEQYGDKRDFKRREMEHELGHETNNYAVVIDGRQWKVFADKRQAENIARSLKNKGKNASVRPTSASVSESKIPDKCPECGGKLVAESELNEEGNKDACYHKVKSRYKVWPSAYASGALVKCRKVGASNWGNKKK